MSRTEATQQFVSRGDENVGAMSSDYS
jgi:hypothetical protein